MNLSSPAQPIGRALSVLNSVADVGRRLRYRHADLVRLSPSERVAMATDREAGFQWLPIEVGSRVRSSIRCPSESLIAYEATLPADARVVAWCALAPGLVQEDADVDFEICVTIGASKWCARRVVRCQRGRQPARWHMLQVNVGGSGRARIVLTTAGPAGARHAMHAVWGDPTILTPRPLRDVVAALRSAMFKRDVRSIWLSAVATSDQSLYRVWARRGEPSRGELDAQRRWASGRNKLFTLITFVQHAEDWRPQPTAASLFAQSYPGWEWLLVVARDSMDTVGAATASYRDRRVRVLGVCRDTTRADAWNAALRETRGELAALLDGGDTLSPDALFRVAESLERASDTDVLYSDEDRTTGQDLHRTDPHFKPDWSPDLLLSYNYIGRLAMLRVTTTMTAGGFRERGAATEWELFLRLSRRASRFRRLPHCLYHRRDVTEEPGEGSVVHEHCRELGFDVAVGKAGGAARLVWPVRGEPTVSIVIPNRNATAVFRRCVTGLLHETSYPHLEIVVIDNGSTDAELLELYRTLESDGRTRVVPFGRTFNFSAACNAGAAAARGDLLLFLNNDVEVIDADWLDELIRWAERPEIGIVGAKLLYPNRTIQHAGVVFGLGLVGHIFAGAREGASGLFGSTEWYRNYSAVTGACQMMRREVFERLGGFDDAFRLSFSDVVLCMEAWNAGYRVVYTPYARLVHHESFTRARQDSPEDLERLAHYLQRTGFGEDPYFHPELNPKSPVPALRPPFDAAPAMVVRDRIERAIAARWPAAK